jgi:hypothetical protein
MEKEKSKKRLNLKKILVFIIIAFFVVITLVFITKNISFQGNDTKKMYVASINKKVIVYDKKLRKLGELVRGVEVINLNSSIKDKEKKNTYEEIKYQNRTFYINKNNLTKDKNKVIGETKMYIRTPTTVYTNLDTGEISGVVKKGESIDITGYNKIDDTGTVEAYKILYNNNPGYVYEKYLVTNESDSLLNYEPDKYYTVHQKRGNTYGGGNASNLDYYPVTKPKFKDNVMPKTVYALYLNDGNNVIGNVDAYIEYAKTTKINAFVVDIKDNQAPGYKSKVFEKDSPTNYKRANNSFDKYKEAIKKIKDAGFYVIGRITVFKDKYYIEDHPENAILDTRTNQPFLHSGTYWPSPYIRDVWEFNIDLAKEAVTEMGFNEIQFDYVRFPDRTLTDEKNGILSFQNTYNEEKSQAVQRFLMYACDELHKLNVYVSADVFGESAYSYVTAYGQYWAAISNVVDVISGMPYPDHFNIDEFGFKDPVWTTPYKLLNYWGSTYVMKRQTEIPTPAIIRTWIEAYDAKGGAYPYGVKEIDEEIRGLFDAGLNGGYMTWSSSSNLSRYKSQVEVYKKEY